MRSILIINPNSTESMTEALKPLVEKLGFKDTNHTYFTAPSGPRSINNEHDAAESAAHCLPALESSGALQQHDGFLVACYSAHPLVPQLKAHPTLLSSPGKWATGIFEASVSASLLGLGPGERFGIVSTGKVFEELLEDAVRGFLGTGERSSQFAGVETTGLDAVELHEAPREEVERRMKDATRRLLGRGKVGAVCLGCAGMAGMEGLVRAVCGEVLGEEGERVRVVDGVVAGVAALEGLLRAGF